MRNAVQRQVANPEYRAANHVRRSLVWNTTQNIKRIQAMLTADYSFEKDVMEDLVKAMFEFINGVVGENDVKGMEVTDEAIVK